MSKGYPWKFTLLTAAAVAGGLYLLYKVAPPPSAGQVATPGHRTVTLPDGDKIRVRTRKS
jgi:hypothetical protein